MKVTKEQMGEHRRRILEAAAKLFRERGFDGIGVADLMRAAGLTHGGFYGHFASKQDLMAQAAAQALAQGREALARRVETQAAAPMRVIADEYLSTRHRDKPGHGCAIAALGADAARQDAIVRRAMTEGVQEQLDFLGAHVTGETPADRRERALVAYATMVGALVLARTVDDPVLSEEVLVAAAEAVAAAGDPTSAPARA